MNDGAALLSPVGEGRVGAISREKTTLFLNICSRIVVSSIIFIIFAHGTPDVGQE